MWQFKSIITGNFLQFVRSYSFLLVLAVSLYVSFSFIPGPEASYKTIQFGTYSGAYNATWIGLATAILSSIFLSFFGFFLINGTIKKDIETRIGAIISASSISNFKYLLTKALANFLVLLSILVIVFLMSIMLFFLYGKEYTFNFPAFIFPYVYIALPSLFFIAFFSLLLEVFIPKQNILQYVIFIGCFFYILFANFTQKQNNSFDVFGIQEPLKQVEKQFNPDTLLKENKLTIGFVSGSRDITKVIEVRPVVFSGGYFLSRFIWIAIIFIALFFAAFFFHRFSLSEREALSEKVEEEDTDFKKATFQMGTNVVTKNTFGLQSLIKIEFALLSRKNTKTLLSATIICMAIMFFVSIQMAHEYVLPLLWFLQILVLSDLETKDHTQRTFFFTASAYKPLQRVFISRILAAILWMFLIASPLWIRLLIKGELNTFLSILLGAVFIVLLAVFLGIITQSKKLFEIVFFFMVYCNLNSLPITDYFGALHQSMNYTIGLLLLISLLFLMSYFMKKNYVR
ncbi:hypothetical protein [Flavobacterium sp. J27]|uniref:hypothetical protein n=1 Tax=Flavobacterium sp. J27 TaxID=2060419 RepID=UPI001030F43B|nr:hypothetical protein [Flavobacterium sp. J27]